jgi:hypothetical protein
MTAAQAEAVKANIDRGRQLNIEGVKHGVLVDHSVNLIYTKNNNKKWVPTGRERLTKGIVGRYITR